MEEEEAAAASEKESAAATEKEVAAATEKEAHDMDFEALKEKLKRKKKVCHVFIQRLARFFATDKKGLLLYKNALLLYLA